jgi:hypothetical protein
MEPGALNERGPCTGCGAQLAADQRYCVECGQRVGPPLALPYALHAPDAAVPAAKWTTALPMPPQMVSAFAALALGFGAVVGTAISPSVSDIIAAPSPGEIAEAPPETPPAPTGGGGGGAPPPSGGSAPALAASTPSTTGSGSGGGGSGGGGGGKKKKKKKKKQPAKPTLTGTVVRVNPVAGSYTISTGNLVAIHADTLPSVGQKLEVPVRPLANGTYAEDGQRNGVGLADSASFTGTVTYCGNLEQPAEPCDGSSASDHYTYAVSSRGASVLVTAPHPAQGAPPQVGSQVQVAVRIGAAFTPIDPVNPDDWREDPECTPAYDEQSGRPEPPVVATELIQASVSITAQATGSVLETVLQTECLGETPSLILSADDVRQSDRDLAPIEVPAGFDLNRLHPGQAVQADLAIETDGTLTLRGITSDQGVAGADDRSQGQGSLTGT